MSDEREKVGVVISSVNDEDVSREIRLLGMKPELFPLSSLRELEHLNYYFKLTHENIGIVVFFLNEFALLMPQKKDFEEPFDYLTERIKQLPHTIFYREGIHDNVRGFVSQIVNNPDMHDKYLGLDENKNRERISSYELIASKSISTIDDDLFDANDFAQTEYFFDVVLPAIFIADNADWEAFWTSDSTDITLAFRSLGIAADCWLEFNDDIPQNDLHGALKKNDNMFDDLYRKNLKYIRLKSSSVNDLRNQLYPSKNAYDSYLRIKDDERADYICRIIKSIRGVDGLERIIFDLLQQPHFRSKVNSSEKWDHFVYKSYNEFLVDQLINRNTYTCSISKKAIGIFEKLREGDFNLVPYSNAIDIAVYFRKEFGRLQNEVVFKRYIVDGEDFVDEFEELVFLFQEYVSKVRGIEISFEKSFTSEGVVFTITSLDKRLVKENFSSMLEEFTKFITLCANEEELARCTLSDSGLDDEKIDYYISRFKTKSLSILNELRDEYNQKLRTKRLEMVNEALNVSLDSFKENVLTNSLPAELPSESKDDYGMMLSIVNGTGSMIGDDQNNKTDQRLLSCFKRYSDNYEELVNEYNLLKNQITPAAQKKVALNKIKLFLSGHSNEIDAVARRVFIDYLKNL